MVAELAVNNLVQVHKPSEVHESILPFVLSDEWQHPGIRPQVSGPVQDKGAAHSFSEAPFSYYIYKITYYMRQAVLKQISPMTAFKKVCDNLKHDSIEVYNQEQKEYRYLQLKSKCKEENVINLAQFTKRKHANWIFFDV
jgi:hypothetical protein